MIRSFRARIVTVVAVATMAALLVACVAFLANDAVSHRAKVVRDLSVHAGIIGDNAAAAVLFDDPTGALQTLGGLRADPRIVAAAIYTADGDRFASFERPGATPPPVRAPDETLRGAPHQIVVVRPLRFDGAEIGSLYIAADATALWSRLGRYATIASLVFVASLALATGLGERLSHSLVGPLRDLAATAQHVATTRDYGVRATCRTADEIGVVTDAFNAMLDEVQRRDRALLEAQDRLEARVAQRTRDLAAAVEAAEATAAELAISEERFRSLSTSAPLGIFRLDAMGAMVYANPRLLEILDLPEDRCLGHGWLTRLDLVTRQWIQTRLSVPRIGWSREFRRRSDGDEERWVLFACSPAEPDGTRVGTVLDVTERRLADAEREALNAQLREASRRAGMADVATGVLHNVGNVLNSINVSATFLHERLRASKVEAVSRIHTLLEDQEDLASFVRDDPRGRLLPGYIGRLAQELLKERDSLVAEVDGLRTHVDHVKQIVAMQQTLARAGGVTERCVVADVVEEALRLESAAFDKYGIHVERRYGRVPDVVLDKHKLLQILINLVTNAKHALKEVSGERRLTVETSWDVDEGLAVAVADTGVGIPPENLERIFGHGFTSRPDGHGFGLHASALAAREMGGHLRATSAGPGRGARFVLTLPAEVEARDHQPVQQTA